MDVMGIGGPQVPDMLQNIRRLPWIVSFFAFFSVIYVLREHDMVATIGILVIASAVSVLSFLGVIYLYFRKTSVKTLISIQGLEIICFLLSFSLSIYSVLRDAKICQELPVYYFALYPLLAIPAAIYGKYYAVKRWKPRAEWLAACAKMGQVVGMRDLYVNFFANPDPALGKKMTIWIGLAAPTTMLANHFYGGDIIFIILSIFMTWASFSMFVNIIVRNHYVNQSLAINDLIISDM